MTRKRKLALAATILTIVVAFFTSFSLVGREARMVDVIILFFSGFGGGASLVSFRRSGRKLES